MSPGLAAIDRLENATAIAVEHAVLPRAFARFPQSRVNNLRIARIDLHVARAGVFIAIQNAFEIFPAIERSIKAAFFVRSVGMTGHRDENALCIFWIDSELRDLLTVAQTEMRPRLSGIDRFVNPVAD